MPLPSGPGQILSVDYFGPLPITRNGKKHILLYTDRFSRRHIAAYAVTQDERTAEGTARIFVEQNVPLRGCPYTLLSMTIIDECVVKGHTGEKQDQLLYFEILRERQQRTFKLVQESHLVAMSKIQRSHTKLLAILHKLPNFEVGKWVWIYNS